MSNLIFFFVCLAAFVINVAVLFLIGWGFFYPKYDIIILAHALFIVFSIAGMACASDEMK